MIQRAIADRLRLFSNNFRSVLVVGPRQSGKTTLVKQTFPDKPYISLENPDQRLLAETDPRAFLNRWKDGAILDEIQRVPVLFNYLQEILDNTEKDGLFILTGSNNILLQENITQTLAGRLGILDLWPLSYNEIAEDAERQQLNELLIRGFYPEVYDKNRNPDLWYASYIRTYIERDVRQIKNITNILLFTRFLKLCAGRIGQQLNLASLGSDCGIDVRTVQSWLSVLESTYVIKLLEPFYNNFNKRLVKSPKLYFVDTGLACSLLSIKKASELDVSHFRGGLVENFFIMECLKNNANLDKGQNFFYWRDNKGLEVDLIIQTSADVIPIEIKSAQTFSNDFKTNLTKFNKFSNIKNGFVIYDGPMEFETSGGITVLNWRSFLQNG